MLSNTLKGAALFVMLTVGLGTQAYAQDVPKALKSLEKHGVEIDRSFDAPSGLDGYIVNAGGQLMTVFVTDDGEHVIVGNLLDAEGNDVGSKHIQDAESERYADSWDDLENSHWVSDGSKDAERVVYTFTDANCPFCNKFWQQSQPWVEDDKVEVRHIMVGILREDSVPKAASIMQAKDPRKALTEHNTVFDNGGIKPASKVSSDINKKLDENLKVMRKLGVSATPVTFYKDADGKVAVKQGLPPEQEMPMIMGSKKP